MKRKISFLLTVILVLSVFSACGRKPAESPVIDEEPPASSEETPPEEPKFAVNPLTGVMDLDLKYENARPVAIMINNIKKSLPQMGVSSADILYEAAVEGSITRLLAIYQNPYGVSMIGSVRSARHYFLDLAQNHNAVFLHYGGSPQAYIELKKRQINSFDGITNSKLFYRDRSREVSMGLEHSAMTSGERISQSIGSSSFKMEMTDSFPKMLRFNETPAPAGDLPVTTVTIPYSKSSTVSYKYDAASENFLRFQYNNMPHMDGLTNRQLEFKNLLILSCKTSAISGDKEGRLDIELVSEGEGYYLSLGTYRKIKWSRTSHSSPFVLSLSDGSPLYLNPGKTAVNIVSLSTRVGFES